MECPHQPDHTSHESAKNGAVGIKGSEDADKKKEDQKLKHF